MLLLYLIVIYCTLEGPSWHNSVSSALSSNDRIFSSGMAIKGVPGWWALHQWDPPTPRKQAINNSGTAALKFKRTYQEATNTEDFLTLSSESESDLDLNAKVNVLNVTESQSENDDLIMPNNYQYGDLIVDDDHDDSSHTHHKLTNQNQITITSAPVTPVVAPSADLKKQLLERLLMMDSSLLDEAIKKAKAKKFVDNSVAAVTPSNESESSLKRKRKIDKGSYGSVDNNNNNNSIKPSVSSTNTNTTTPTTFPLVFAIPKDCQNTLDPFVPFLTGVLTAFPVIRASPYENDLLKKCNRVNYFEIKVAARLRRKLLLRRQRRRVNFALFDIDNFMYLYLKSIENPLKLIYDSHKGDNALNLNDSLNLNVNFDFDPESIPYISDPSRSLYVKLTGMAALYGTCPFPVVSPFSGKLLPEFVWEDLEVECKVPKLLLLNQLKRIKFKFIKDFNLNSDSDLNCDFSNNLKPSYCLSNMNMNMNIIFNDQSNNNPLILKYTNLRKEFVPQLNEILSNSFWPGIDVSEALDYPDYAIIALVGLSVVGCAIINPEGYLSYLHVRQDFQGHGIATRLLSLLLPQLSPRKDLTLHVSVSNTPAIILYQKIGFKPEEFIVNFYDKYLNGSADGNGNGNENEKDSLIGNKNAFLMRLRR